ncbi:MAG: S-adenosyl-l-methionine hydroxide adenosyltransferase family protein [Gemmatimonadota bacterium]
MIITLTTDFRTADGYAGEMKGVILSLCPEARVVDVTHDVPRGDVESGARILQRIWDRYPPGTVHLAVVDPGVGGERRGLAAALGGRWFVGPDNGLLTLAGRSRPVETVLDLGPPPGVDAGAAPTFHGRDVFAPAAARLARGDDPAGLGAPVAAESLVVLPLPGPERVGESVHGRVTHADRFGNLATDIPAAWLGARIVVEIGGARIDGLLRTYAEAAPGELLALVGSDRHLEIAVRDGSAAERLSVGRDAPVVVRVAGPATAPS